MDHWNEPQIDRLKRVDPVPDTNYERPAAALAAASQMMGTTVEQTFAALRQESEELQRLQAEAVARATGFPGHVLDFILDGGIPPSVEALRAWLLLRDVDLSLWGQGPCKSVRDLFHELCSGECEPLTGQGQPLRVISVVKVRILARDADGRVWALYETKQKRGSDGTTRIRNRPLAEKKRPGELPGEAARRGMREELGCLLLGGDACEGGDVCVEDGTLEAWTEHVPSKSFPGLPTQYNLFQVDVVAPQGLRRGVTGDVFETVEESRDAVKVHTWAWRPYTPLDGARDLLQVLRARYAGKA